MSEIVPWEERFIDPFEEKAAKPVNSKEERFYQYVVTQIAITDEMSAAEKACRVFKAALFVGGMTLLVLPTLGLTAYLLVQTAAHYGEQKAKREREAEGVELDVLVPEGDSTLRIEPLIPEFTGDNTMWGVREESLLDETEVKGSSRLSPSGILEEIRKGVALRKTTSAFSGEHRPSVMLEEIRKGVTLRKTTSAFFGEHRPSVMLEEIRKGVTLRKTTSDSSGEHRLSVNPMQLAINTVKLKPTSKHHEQQKSEEELRKGKLQKEINSIEKQIKFIKEGFAMKPRERINIKAYENWQPTQKQEQLNRLQERKKELEAELDPNALSTEQKHTSVLAELTARLGERNSQ